MTQSCPELCRIDLGPQQPMARYVTPKRNIDPRRNTSSQSHQTEAWTQSQTVIDTAGKGPTIVGQADEPYIQGKTQPKRRTKRTTFGEAARSSSTPTTSDTSTRILTSKNSAPEK